MDDKVTISESRYCELVENTATLNALVTMLFNSSKLSYSSSKILEFRDATDIMRCFFPERYAERLKALTEDDDNV